MRRAWTGAALVAAAMASTVAGYGEAAAQERASTSSKARSAIFQSQAAVLDRRAASQYAYSSRLRPEGELTLSLPPAPVRYRGVYLPMAQDAARRHGVPPSLFVRLVQQESAWNPTALSHKGAIGLAQLMPGTARMLGVDPTDPVQNLEGGARYLRQQYDRFGSWRLALAAYNAGPEAVARYDGVPPYRETRTYVLRILGSG